MNLVITGHGLSITPAINEYVRQKLERVLRRCDHVVDAKIVLDVNKSASKDERQTAQFTVHVKGSELVAKVARADMYSAIDSLMDRIDEQLSRYKEKKRSRSVAMGDAAGKREGAGAGDFAAI